MDKLLTGLLLVALYSTSAFASYAQFCRIEGIILDQPAQDNSQAIRFTLKISAAVEYEHESLGEGWGDCIKHVGREIEVCLTPGFQGDSEFRKGQRRVVWRDAMDFSVGGQMRTLVGFSASRSLHSE